MAHTVASSSVRLPAAYTGLYGLRGSYGRIPYAGAVNSLEGQESVPYVLGPLSGTISGIKLFVKAVADGKPWLKDPLARFAPWNEELYKLADHDYGKKLTFGFMADNGHIVPHPPIARAMEMAKEALLAAGHEGWFYPSVSLATRLRYSNLTVIEWKPYKHGELEDVAVSPVGTPLTRMH